MNNCPPPPPPIPPSCTEGHGRLAVVTVMKAPLKQGIVTKRVLERGRGMTTERGTCFKVDAICEWMT